MKYTTELNKPIMITENEFLDGLNVLPPENWRKQHDSESFHICEMLYTDITSIYVKLNNLHYTFNGNCSLTHSERCNIANTHPAQKQQAKT